MLLRECLGLGTLLQGDPDIEIRRVIYDSREAGPGALFVAVPGFKTDGHDYVTDAVARGACAVVVQRPVTAPPEVAVIQVPSSRKALGAFASTLRRWPTRHLRVVGVTGTNGKTTTTHLIRAVLQEQGKRVGLIGTVHNFIGDEELPARLTTPQASDLQDLFAQMLDAHCSHAVMEVSSEGLDMHRVDHVEFDIAVFTNLTQDHLNYHGSWEAYREAKLKLFKMLGEGGTKAPTAAVINVDDPSADHFLAACQAPVYTYGLTPRASVFARDLEVSAAGSHFTLCTPAGDLPLDLSLAGKFNVMNALAAAAAGLAEGVPLAVIARALAKATGVAGRMEPVNAGQPFGLFVDYAHSPDGLENILRTARGFARGRVIVVFGCGGDRDRTKRPLMGRIAAELADFSIITSDNPRTEEPQAILKEIEAGFTQVQTPGRFYELVEDRRQAIARAIEIARPDDVVLVAGKGHETYQIFRDRTVDFDDRAVARQLLQAWLQQAGSEIDRKDGLVS